MYDDFVKRIINNPEYEIIRDELSTPEGECQELDLGHGVKVMVGSVNWSKEDHEKSDLWGEICWHINNGPGYCEMAPAHIKVYLKRLGAV